MTFRKRATFRGWMLGFVVALSGLTMQACAAGAGENAQGTPPGKTSDPAPNADFPYPVYLTFHDEFTDFSRFDETRQTGRWRTQFGYGGPTMLQSRALASNGQPVSHRQRRAGNYRPTGPACGKTGHMAAGLYIGHDRHPLQLCPALWLFRDAGRDAGWQGILACFLALAHG